MTGIDLSEHGEEAYHGNDLSDLTGRSTPLGDSVIIPVEMLKARNSSPRLKNVERGGLSRPVRG
jgi:hypothetical protein